jgi:hypothetical protein
MNSRCFSNCAILATAIALASMTGCVIVESRSPYAPGPGYPRPGPMPPAAEVDSQLQQLVAPVALYPDPLLAQLLPATTYPDQLQAAGQWLQANPNPPEEAIASQPWEASVKAMVHYPDALQVLNNDPQWTASLGSAFNSEPQAVMAAIQDMRQMAQSAGSLTSNSQAEVVTLDSVIAIQPANPEAIYVPTYDPLLVYTSNSPLVYGVAYVPGVWLVNGVDWYGRTVFVGNWHGGWRYDHGHWGRDRYWHYDRFHDGWHHNDRFGRAPYFARGHYATPRGFHGREAVFHRAVVEHVSKQPARTPSYHTDPQKPTPGNPHPSTADPRLKPPTPKPPTPPTRNKKDDKKKKE